MTFTYNATIGYCRNSHILSFSSVAMLIRAVLLDISFFNRSFACEKKHNYMTPKQDLPCHLTLLFCNYILFLGLGGRLLKQELAWHRWQLGLFMFTKKEKRTTALFISGSSGDFFFSKVSTFMHTCVDLCQNRRALLQSRQIPPSLNTLDILQTVIPQTGGERECSSAELPNMHIEKHRKNLKLKQKVEVEFLILEGNIIVLIIHLVSVMSWYCSNHSDHLFCPIAPLTNFAETLFEQLLSINLWKHSAKPSTLISISLISLLNSVPS